MTEIRFEDAQVGDRVKVTRTWTDGDRITREFTVISAGGDFLDGQYISASVRPLNGETSVVTVELVDRPAPPAKCGDIREDPETGARYVRTDDYTAVAWVKITGRHVGRNELEDRNNTDAAIIARLRPVTP